MRFSSISIINYRQYRNLSMEFKKAGHDLQVIVGDNGTGKTNLLNAFTWCLYGTEPHLGTSDKYKGEPKLNKDAIQDAIAHDLRTENIEIAIEIEFECETARVTRKLPVRICSQTELLEKKTDEEFYIQCMPETGTAKVLKGELAESYIERHLPEGIREYFFFDGEQLSNYFSNKRNEAIKAAIHSISQIDLVTRMRDRTDTCIKTMRRSLNKSLPSVSTLNEEIDKNERIFKKYDAEREGLERQVHNARDRIDELGENLRNVPDIAKLETERDLLKKKAADYERDVAEAQAAYINFARTAFVDFAFYDAVEKSLASISGMEQKHQLPPSIDRGYIEEMLHEHICKVCNRPLSEEDQRHLEEILERYQVSNETSHILIGIRNELRRLIDRVHSYPQSRDKAMGALRRAESRLIETQTQLDKIEGTIASFPDSERVKQWHSERTQLEQEVDKYLEEIGSKKRTAELARNKREKKEAELREVLRKQTQQKDLGNAIDFGSRAVKLLDNVEKDIISEIRTMMAAKTESLFKGLVWKDSKCDHIELSETYQLSLYDRAGYSCAGTCSAAERALLALSFTLAMHDVSGFDSPLFIDTPIARASGENRANFADTLAEVSKRKQLILTFTPDEYSESIASVFDPIAASRMRLILDDEERVVSIRSE